MNSRIWIIIQHEFLKRARSKWYILTTILGPFLFAGIMVLPAFVMQWAQSADDVKQVAVVDETEVLVERLQGSPELRGNYAVSAATVPVDSLRQRLLRETLDAYLHLPAGILREEAAATYYSSGGEGLLEQPQLERAINNAVREYRLDQQQVPDSIRAIFEGSVTVDMRRMTPEGEKSGGTPIFAAIGYGVSFVIYFMVFMYGMFVMRGVIEEKSNRVVELMASSARPFQLMMGKIVGIGALGLVQVTVWISLIIGVLTFAGLLVAPFVELPASAAGTGMMDAATQEAALEAAGITIPDLPPSLFVYFLIFFLGGYLLYASLFAMVGSAVDQESDAQTLQLPIMLPLFIPIILINYIVAQPDSVASIIFSLVPFFSPILMIVRTAMIAVPFWQIAAAIVLLFGTFLGMVWIAGRVYRIGILMYGKSASFKDLVRWFRYG